MVESAPPFQIGYGYGYSPQDTIPTSTLDFAQHYYPYMRFGLTFALMNDGYFAHEFGDTWHGNNWWYDELDFDLGLPLGPAQQVALPGTPATNLLVNGGFENSTQRIVGARSDERRAALPPLWRWTLPPRREGAESRSNRQRSGQHQLAC